ncbi:unnamed protein product [Toxocara canis]|uniref:Uncharacterized protein n=1 Tax=Toxocara canis TaxID=6265 RepID=A0A183VEN3_TOXCA|nr:unnamed protein product [Toxocara canis]
MPDLDILKCPKCSDRLEPLELEMFEEDGKRYQRIASMCRGIAKQVCDFPTDMPHEVFWTKRTEQQISVDFMPLPQIQLLPEHYHYLYPKFFSTVNSAQLCALGQEKTRKTKRKRCAYAVNEQANNHNSSAKTSTPFQQTPSKDSSLIGDPTERKYVEHCVPPLSTDSVQNGRFASEPVVRRCSSTVMAAKEFALLSETLEAPMALSLCAPSESLVTTAIPAPGQRIASSTCVPKTATSSVPYEPLLPVAISPDVGNGRLSPAVLPERPSNEDVTPVMAWDTTASCESPIYRATGARLPEAVVCCSETTMVPTEASESGAERILPPITLLASAWGENISSSTLLASDQIMMPKACLATMTITPPVSHEAVLPTAVSPGLDDGEFSLNGPPKFSSEKAALSMFASIRSCDANQNSVVAASSASDVPSTRGEASAANRNPSSCFEYDCDNDNSVRTVIIDDEWGEETETIKTFRSPQNNEKMDVASSERGRGRNNLKILKRLHQVFDSFRHKSREGQEASVWADEQFTLTSSEKNSEKRKKRETKDAFRRVPARRGEPSPFEPSMLARAGMFDKYDWRKPVKFGCGSAVDAFVSASFCSRAFSVLEHVSK